jgi:hypothetical protein
MERNSLMSNVTRLGALAVIAWPTRMAPSDALRKALYISQNADHIKVTNMSADATLASSDTTAIIPFGQAQASIPAFVGNNTWHFSEYYANENLGEIASADSSAPISSADSPTSVDVVLSLNLFAMGVSLNSDSPSVCNTLPIPLNYSDGTVQVNTLGPVTFNLYLQPTDVGLTFGNGRVVSGPGTPGLSLTSSDPRVTLARFVNPNPAGPYPGIAYQVKMNQALANSSDSITLQANALDPTGNVIYIASVSIVQSCGF